VRTGGVVPKPSIRSSTSGVCITLPMSFLLDPATPLFARISYAAADPYAVTVLFCTQDQSVQWVFARDLLADGLIEEAGHGDVHVWPIADDSDARSVGVELDSPDGVVELTARRRDITRFLEATYRLVPRGAESAHLDIDAELAILCAD